jgi:hypothetical protein
VTKCHVKYDFIDTENKLLQIRHVISITKNADTNNEIFDNIFDVSLEGRTLS